MAYAPKCLVKKNMKRNINKWSSEDEAFLKNHHGYLTISDLSSSLGRSNGSVRGKITKMGLSKKILWSDREVERLKELYESAGDDGPLFLDKFALEIGRDPGNVSRKAADLGLNTNRRRKKVLVGKPTSRAKYKSREELSKARSEMMTKWHSENCHPMKGKKHSQDSLILISAASKASYLMKTEEERSERVMKSLKTRYENQGTLAPKVKRGSWAAGWRDIGGKRNYYRSAWEANYARYLEWLKQKGEITEWLHEPEVFWFESIKRGVRSYNPDFRVWETNGFSCLHEVKGWMDARSKTCLSRMKKYHPSEKIVLIDAIQYANIKLKVSRMIEGWE